VLAGAARGWIIFAIVWGSILFLSESAIQSAFQNNNSSSVDQYNSVVTHFNDTRTAVQSAGNAAQTCSTVQCIRPSHLAAADSFSSSADNLQGMSLPSNASGSARRLESDARQLSTVFKDLANSSDARAYQATANRSNLSALLTSYSGDTQNLLNKLRSDIS
jgi:outer membrane murein-binding lipoprotein Lpp